MGTQITSPLQNASPLSEKASDNTPANSTGGTLATLAVSAGSVSNYIIVIVDHEAYAVCGAAAGAASVNLQIDIDATNKVDRKMVEITKGSDGASQTGKVGSAYVFYYEPSAGEKAAGFNVVIKCTTSLSGSGDAATEMQYKSCEVLGY